MPLVGDTVQIVYRQPRTSFVGSSRATVGREAALEALDGRWGEWGWDPDGNPVAAGDQRPFEGGLALRQESSRSGHV